MTSAQKLAKEKFKKAIAYRQKSGVSLKEAFAHVYGKKKVAKKKVARKKVAKKRIAGPKDSSLVRKELARKGLKMPHGYTTTKRKRKISGVKKKKITERAVLKSIQNAVKVQKSHMGGMKDIKKEALEDYQKVLNRINIAKFKVLFNDEQAKLSNKKSNTYKAFIKNKDLAKKYLKELETHARELKKHI